eukprot:TRINITY_DN19096_c0_g1_i1.p1 TRINITY_DN19096_c0_g1~~TRINITY_DN19096_c0_g1_i1.p1  ORF type:complete len:175 (+),score=66.40 TRINITY_DN19096_c0_g1_i1:143-667(+)
MSMRVRMFKARQRFAAAHMTLYPDGSCERLHGHNYTIEATFHSDVKHLQHGVLVPFDVVKTSLQQLCDTWHEHVLMPSKSPYITVNETEEQVEITLSTDKIPRKFYSFPREDVVLMDCDNISCENMSIVALNTFMRDLPQSIREVTHKVTLTISEGPGSEVSIEADVADYPYRS